MHQVSRLGPGMSRSYQSKGIELHATSNLFWHSHNQMAINQSNFNTKQGGYMRLHFALFRY